LKSSHKNDPKSTNRTQFYQKKKKFKFERNTGTNSIPNIPLIKNQNPKYIGNFNYDPRPPLKKKIKNK
jgi:hypothetical protein